MPLQKHYCKQRRENLLEQVQADMVVISNPRHVLYFSGYWVTPLQIGTWGTPHLLIDTSNGRTTLLTHNFAPDIQTAFVDEVHKWHWYNGASAPSSLLFPTIVAQLKQHLTRNHLAIESGWFPDGVTDVLKTDITAQILSMRRAKDPDELAMIQACIKAVEAGHKAARHVITPGITEIDVYNSVYAAIVAEAGEPVLPLSDFVSGERVSEVGGPPTHRVLQAGEVMIVDLFPVIGGYKADFTATYAVSESLTEDQKRLETALHAALKAGEQQLKPGNHAKPVYQAVRVTLDNHGYENAFPHHAGHGLGLGHPEAPFFVQDSEDVVQVGDIVTLEPGAYGSGFGGRIEHNYRITADGFERLTNHNIHF